MRLRLGRVLGVAAFSLAVQALAASSAFAHAADLVATAECTANATGVINWTASSWLAASPGGDNPTVDIYLNGVKIATSYFGPGHYSFSGSVAAPLGTSATMAAAVVGQWGDGVDGGQNTWITVQLPTDCLAQGDGRFTGGGSQIRVDNVRVTRGLTVHCDLLLSNNLEINWNGNQFHMLEHMETVRCSDDPNIIQAPPAAPLDTMVGVGRGRYNGVDGYTVEFTFMDYGEPGNFDKAALKVYQTSNPANIVLNVPLQVLAGGNLQAHYDQPHK